MRVNTVNQNPNAGSGFNIAGATLTGPLILAGDPTQALEASTKKYIDNAVSSLNAGYISTGTLPVGRLPAFTGDFSNVIGTNTLTLITTPVVPGNYTKVTVDAKGRVQAGATLSLVDIPSFNWSKITNNKPTTIDGYGITDAVKNTSDSMTGALLLHAAPVVGTHAATKGYVDSLSSGSSILSTGDTIRRPNTTTPTGFLRCNGAQVTKSMYPALYAAVGDNAITTYSIQGNGHPYRNQYDINKFQSGSLGAWTTETALPFVLTGFRTIVTKNRAFVIGGYNGSNPYVILSAPLDASGNVGAWSYSATLPANISNHAVLVYNSKVYLICSYNGNAIAIYTAPINTDGTLGSWTLELTNGVAGSGTLINNTCVFVTKNRIYICGGHDDNTWTNKCYYISIASNGTLSTPVVTNSLPAALGASCCVTTKNRVYLLGGIDSSNVCNTVYTAPINADGSIGSWSGSTALPVTMYGASAVVTNTDVYILSGTNSSTNTYRAPINADGTLGTWVTGVKLPALGYSTDAFITGNKVYTFGSNGEVFSAAFTGGYNDYSYWYGTMTIPGDPVYFTLPDTTATDSAGVYTFIKT